MINTRVELFETRRTRLNQRCYSPSKYDVIICIRDIDYPSPTSIIYRTSEKVSQTVYNSIDKILDRIYENIIVK